MLLIRSIEVVKGKKVRIYFSGLSYTCNGSS